MKQKYIQTRNEHEEILRKSRKIISAIFSNLEEYVSQNNHNDEEFDYLKNTSNSANIINKLSSSLLKIIEKEEEILSENPDEIFPAEKIPPQKISDELDLDDIKEAEKAIILAKLEKGLIKPNEVDFTKFDWPEELIDKQILDEITAELENEKLNVTNIPP
ncbi:MAG: hypothetical protein SFT90_03090 [Rickettsiales bacterium]|nr:hypothetical protein [Rickettsiales bacterium]